MKFQVLGMSLFCAATLAAALPVEPTTELPTLPCVSAKVAATLPVIPGAPKPKICEEEPKNEKRDVPTPEECQRAEEGLQSGNVEKDLERILATLKACYEAHEPSENEKRQAKEPSILNGAVGTVIGDVSRVAGR